MAERKAPIATPDKSSPVVPLCPPTRATQRTQSAASSPPTNANRLTVPIPQMAVWAQKMVAIAAPSAAPEDTPRMCGSARGLEKTACMDAPDTESAAPVT